MGLLGSGFGEMRRKFNRLLLARRIKAAQRTHADALRSLGRRAAEAGITGGADEALKAALADTEARDRDLGTKLGALEEQIRTLEAQRDADAARFRSLADEVRTRKSPLDAELAAQQKAAARHRQDSDDVKRRLGKAAEAQPPEERQKLEALLAELAGAASAADAEVARVRAAIAPLQAELDRIEAQRAEAAARANGALADLRKQASQVRSASAGVSRERDTHLEKLGAVLAAAGMASPALAAEAEAVAAAARARDGLQAEHDASLAESRSMPKGTMAKFAGLMLASGLALAAGGFAVKYASEGSKARTAAKPAQVSVSDCPVPSVKYKVVANPGGPYNPTRGQVVHLNGGRSTGHCLRYTWTFSAAPPDEDDGPRHKGATPEDQAIFDAVHQIACPDGQAGNPRATKTGRVAETKFLCSLKVTLTVTDYEGKTDSKDVIVRVKPRNPEQWKTRLEEAQREGYIEGSKLAAGQLEMGKNFCAIDPSPAHALHAGSPWRDVGYKAAKVDDPNGPFDGWWHVAESDLRIKRGIEINADFTPGGELDKENATKRFTDFAILRRSVIEHERQHGLIIFERIKEFQKQGNDPARLLEPLSVPADAEASLHATADMAIRQVESWLYPGQGSPEYIAIHREIKARLAKNKAYDRPGRILIRDGSGGFTPRDIPNMAAAGEDSGF